MSSDLPDVLAPLRGRYAHWLGLDRAQVVADRDEAAADVRALQLVLRMERGQPPSWHDAVALAASATAMLCTDPRATTPEGPWQAAVRDYAGGHIRKVTRRARASQWWAVQDLPGITLGVAGRSDGAHDDHDDHDADPPPPTEVRALVPGRVTELDKRVAKLQVGGTDVPVDGPGPEPAVSPLLRIWLPPDPLMTLGKTMAQAGHASMIAAALLAGEERLQPVLADWVARGCAVFPQRAGPERWAVLLAAVRDPRSAWSQERLLAVRDAGFTEIAPGTVTVVAELV